MYRLGDYGYRFRPFSDTAALKSNGYSCLLQRAITDFGADESFCMASKKLYEHYGIVINPSMVRLITEKHAKAIAALDEQLSTPVAQQAKIIIAQSDGSMIPIVNTSAVKSDSSEQSLNAPRDQRKNKQLSWKEARLSLAHATRVSKPCFAGTMKCVATAGQQLLSCVIQAGASDTSKVHCVGDGAPWIANQVAEKFGANGSYLIDFYLTFRTVI